LQYRDEIIAIMDKQIAKGYNKYGIHLEDNPRTLIDSLEAACEELVDNLVYMREAIQKVKTLEARLANCEWAWEMQKEQIKVLIDGQK
jgi:hypothetical protein